MAKKLPVVFLEQRSSLIVGNGVRWSVSSASSTVHSASLNASLTFLVNLHLKNSHEPAETKGLQNVYRLAEKSVGRTEGIIRKRGGRCKSGIVGADSVSAGSRPNHDELFLDSAHRRRPIYTSSVVTARDI